MRKRAIITILIISVICLMACGSGSDETRESTHDEVAEIGIQNEIVTTKKTEPGELTGELTILSWFPFNNWQYVIEAFTKEHPGVTVIVDMPEQEEMLMPEFMERYTTKIITGEGIDIVEPDLVNMERCVEQGFFVDLYELMDADEEFHREDYFSCIFKPVETEGKLPAFIYSVSPVYIHLNKRLLDMAGLEYTEETISFNKLYELYEEVREVAGERIFLTASGYGYEGMAAYEDEYFIRNGLMDSDEYEQYLRMRHELYYTLENRPLRSDGTMSIEDNVFCCPSDLRLPGNGSANRVFEGTDDITGAILYESMHGEHYFESPLSLSISSFSKNKELAWEFLKFAFSDQETSISNSSLISSNKRKVESVCEELSAENQEKLFSDIEKIDMIRFTDMNLSHNLESVYEDYFVNNTITAEECCKELASRVYLYMNE